MIGALLTDILIIGSLDHIEIWNPEVYEDYEAKFGGPLGEKAENIDY